MVPFPAFPVIFLKSKKKNSRMTPQNMCSARSTHTRLPRFFWGVRGNGGSLLPRFFLSNVHIIPDPGVKVVLNALFYSATNKRPNYTKYTDVWEINSSDTDDFPHDKISQSVLQDYCSCTCIVKLETVCLSDTWCVLCWKLYRFTVHHSSNVTFLTLSFF